MEIIKGDILEVKKGIVIIPVNCVGVMGKGLALSFKKMYKELYRTYVNLCFEKKITIGRVVFVRYNDDLTFCFFPTKRHWREKSSKDIVVRGLEVLYEDLSKKIKQNISLKEKIICLPMLACGAGGMSEEEVLPLINRYLISRLYGYVVKVFKF